jgi:hypothetical protein
MNFMMTCFRQNKAALVFVAILAATLLLYGGALDNWWCCDDTQIIKHAIQFSPLEYFFVPEAWRALIPYSLTPWLTMVYDFDHALFGFNPYGFYVHNLLTITLCAWLLYLIACQWVSDWYAIGGVTLFLVGSPIAVASQQLMVRHYVEGLLFYLLTLWLVIRGVRSEQTRYGIFAGMAYAIAASAKEVYLPLGFIPILLPVGNFQQRLSMAWPLLLVMGLYVPWRWYMLGDVVGGYTPAGKITVGEFYMAGNQFAHIPILLWTTPGLALTGTGFVGVAALVRGGKSGRMSSLWRLLLPPLLSLPLFPLVSFPGLGAGSERYFIALWAAFTLVFAVVLGLACKKQTIWVRILGFLLFCVVTIPAWNASRSVHANMSSMSAEYRAHGMAIANLDEHAIIFASPGVASWYNQGMADLRPAMGKGTMPPLIVADEYDLSGLDLKGRRVLRYEQDRGAMMDITSEVPVIMSRWREKLRAVSFSVKLEYDPGLQSLRWQFGPYETGRYIFLSGGVQISVPLRGSLRMVRPLPGCFRIRLDSPEGWTAYSTSLALDTAGNKQAVSRLSWEGMSICLTIRVNQEAQMKRSTKA